MLQEKNEIFVFKKLQPHGNQTKIHTHTMKKGGVRGWQARYTVHPYHIKGGG